MIQDVFRHKPDTFRSHIGLFSFDAPYFLIRDVIVHIHRFDIVHTERQDVLVVDRVHNGIGMELVSECLGSGHELRIMNGSGIRSENGRAGESENMIPFEALDNVRPHITELAAVTLIKDHDDMLIIYIMNFVPVDKIGQLLDRCNNNSRIRIFQLFFQDRRAAVTVGAIFLKPVVFLHGLVVQVLPVHDKQHLIDIRQPTGCSCRFE